MECNCPKKQCERYGNCDACIAYHNTVKRKPYCLPKSKTLRKSSLSSIAVILTLCLVLIISGCNSFTDNKYKDITEMPIGKVDISGLDDGGYTGEFSYGKNTYTVGVTISGQRIENVELDVDTKESNLEYVNKARVLIDEVIATQSLDVDTVSGATRSSKSILKAIENALTK